MNRRAEESFEIAKKSIYWMVAGVMIVMIALVFVMFLGRINGDYTYNPPQLEVDFITMRFANTVECFAYVDDSGILHPNTIDLNKFTQDRLQDECYPIPSNDNSRESYNFGLSLENLGDSPNIVTKKYFNINDQVKLIPVTVYQNGVIVTGDINLRIVVQYEAGR